MQCSNDKLLRRITGKRLTADSLIITYKEQRRHEEFGFAGYCYAPAQVVYSAIAAKRWSLARAGNQWQPNGAPLQLATLWLLTGEYVAGKGPMPGPLPYLLVGLPVPSGGGNGCDGQLPISYTPYYQQNSQQSSTSPIHATGFDYAAWHYRFGAGQTTTGEFWNNLIYSCKLVNGAMVTCGSALGFVNLLPTRAVQAAAVATLYPNPATDQATLTLAQPVRPGSALRLTGALSRTVWTALVPTGQTTVAVPLAGQPAGLYLLHLIGSKTTPVSWKLNYE